ncbi:hypothetical protein C0993_000975, partial [Termitomyces sp. T159_Od127]
ATEKSALQETNKELHKMIEKLWEAPVPISTKELLTVAPGSREAMVQKLVPKPPRPKEPNVPRRATQHMIAVEKEPNKVDIGDLPEATYFIADGAHKQAYLLEQLCTRIVWPPIWKIFLQKKSQ